MREETDRLRRAMRELRDALGADERDRKNRMIKERLLCDTELARAGRIFCFASFGSEVDLWPVMKIWLEQGRLLALPRMEGKEIRFYEYRENTELIRHRYGILEPNPGEEIVPVNGDVILVPGLIYSETGHRIGYGGGFYDRYLSAHRAGAAIGVAYEEQRGTYAPAPWDERLDALITDCGRIDYR